MSNEGKPMSNYSRVLWVAGVLLSFFMGMAVMNGYATEQALQVVNGNCHWTLRHELWKQQRALEQ